MYEGSYKAKLCISSIVHEQSYYLHRQKEDTSADDLQSTLERSDTSANLLASANLRFARRFALASRFARSFVITRCITREGDRSPFRGMHHEQILLQIVNWQLHVYTLVSQQPPICLPKLLTKRTRK